VSGETRAGTRKGGSTFGDERVSTSSVPDLTRFGLAVGHATDEAGGTGITVIRGVDTALRAGAAVFGRATGSREFHTASADHIVNGRVDAIVLTGGSAYGLDAVGGVMRWMEERGRGYAVGGGVVPIVPAAVVFDLAPLGKFSSRPTVDMAYQATESARSREIAEGSVGAGTGTTVGKLLGIGNAMKGGFGCSVAAATDDSIALAAMVVVNALGDVRDARGDVIAGARNPGGGFADAVSLMRSGASMPKRGARAMQNTTLAVVASSAPLSAVELMQLARAAGAAFFRRITPAGSSSDGDVVFAVSPEGGARVSTDAMIIETLAVAALEDAIERAVRLARGREGIPGLADEHGN
jgi:L-aminopeptidase/D-esterase-like protein